MKFEKIIFDFDGVILNSHIIKSKAFKNIFKEFNNKISNQAYKYHLNNVGKSRYQKFRYILKKNFKNIRKDQIDNLNKQFNEYCDKRIDKLKISAHLLKFFRKNFHSTKFYISTGTPESKIKETVKKKKINKYFKKIYGSPKKKEEHIKMIIRKTNKKKILFIGDSLEDLKASKKTNINFLLKVHSENRHLSNEVKKKFVSFKNFQSFLSKL